MKKQSTFWLIAMLSIQGSILSQDSPANDSFIELESAQQNSAHADLAQALHKRAIKQLDSIDLTFEELAQAVNTAAIKVADKKTFVSHISSVRTSIYTLKVSHEAEEQAYTINNLEELAYGNRIFINHLHKLLDRDPMSEKDFDEPLLDRKSVRGHKEFDTASFSRLLFILGENDQALKRAIAKNRLAGSSEANRFFKASEKLAKQHGAPKLIKRLIPYGLLGMYALFRNQTPIDELPFYLRPIKKLVGSRPYSPHVGPKNDTVPVGPFTATHGVFGTPAWVLGDVISFDPSTAVNLGLTVYFAKTIMDDAQDLYKWFGEKSKWAFTRLKGESYEDPSPVKASKISFDDITGYEHIKLQLETIVQYFKTKDIFDRLGTHVDRGYLMVGPLDVGKLLIHGLADAITKELKVNNSSAKCGIYDVHSSALITKDITEMIKEVEEETSVYPCIILIDDLNWLIDHAKSKPELWSNLVGAMNSNLRGNKKQIFIFATARETSTIYSTMKGQGKLGTLIQFTMPTLEERAEYFKKQLTKRSARIADFNINELAAHTQKCSYETLAAVIKSAFGSAHANKEIVKQRHLEEAIDNIVYGIILHEDFSTPEQRKMLASHFAGRALAHALKRPDAHFKVTILPIADKASSALPQGALIEYKSNNHHEFVTDLDLLDQALIELAGGEAEKLTNNGKASAALGEATKAKAFGLIRKVVFQGLNDKELTKEIKKEKLSQVWEALTSLTQDARELLEQNRARLEVVIKGLQEKHILTSEEIRLIPRDRFIDSVFS